MTNIERIQINNKNLRDCIETAEKLPEAGGSGGSGIIDVTELPTSGIDENAVYRITEKVQTGVTDIYAVEGKLVVSLAEYLAMRGITTVPNIYEVDELPSDMKASDITTFTELHFYVSTTDGKCYLYVSEYGMVVTAGYILFNDPSYDKGSTHDVYAQTEPGVYTILATYEVIVSYYIRENGEWKRITPDKQSKRVEITKNGTTEVIPDEGKVLSKVSVSVDVPTKTAKTQSLEVTENGLYVPEPGYDGFSGVFVDVQTKTPNIRPLEIAENGTYTALDGVDGYSPVTVNVSIPDGYIVPNGTKEITENGTHDVTEYSFVNVNVASSGENNDTRFADSVMDTLISVDDETITSMRPYAFCYCQNLVTARLPSITVGATCAFRYCNKLEMADLPKLAGTCGSYLFDNCPSLFSVNIPKVTGLSTWCLSNCAALKKVELGNLSTINANAFNASSLEALIIRKTGTSATTLSNINAFSGTPIADGLGYIYVYKDMVDKFKTATNWSNYANQFRAIEDYPEICGGV